MELGERIFLRRKQLDMTLEDVARVVGVGRSTVRKWEKGIISNMRRDKIAKLAEALQTTPAYIMGWVDDADFVEKNTLKPVVSPFSCTSEEQSLIEAYRQASQDDRTAVQLILKKYQLEVSSPVEGIG